MAGPVKEILSGLMPEVMKQKENDTPFVPERSGRCLFFEEKGADIIFGTGFRRRSGSRSETTNRLKFEQVLPFLRRSQKLVTGCYSMQVHPCI